MSLSINDILKPLGSIIANAQPIPANKLFNPDLPTLSKAVRTFNDIVMIKDQAMSAFKLGSQPRNGGDFLLPRTRFDDNPRKDAFLMENAIDPNVIRKRVNPDAAIPSLESGESTKFSLVPSNNVATDFVSLIQMANKNYINYKNRFFVADPSIQQNQQQYQQPIQKTATAVPTTINYNPITYDIGNDELPEFGDGGKKNKPTQPMAPISNNFPDAATYFSNPDLYGAPPKPPVTSIKPSPSYIYIDNSTKKNVSNRIGQTSISTRLGSLGNYLK